MIWFFIFFLATISSIFAQTLAKGLTIKNEYVAGVGLSVGKIILVQGEAFIVHHNSKIGYIVKKGLFLFQKDKIITQDNGRLSFKLNDGSQMSMASNATMTINKSVFDPITHDRSVFINMPKGKSRFTVKKIRDYRRSAVKIKTMTAIIGVRGSDFIVIASEQATKIVTLDETVLEVNSIFDPTAQAVLLQAFEKSSVDEYALPSVPEKVRPEEIESLMDDFTFDKKTRFDIKMSESKKSSHAKVSKQSGNAIIHEDPFALASSLPDEIKTEATDIAKKNESVTDNTQEISMLQNDIIEEETDDEFNDILNNIIAEKIEDEFKGKLPDLPGKPGMNN